MKYQQHISKLYNGSNKNQPNSLLCLAKVNIEHMTGNEAIEIVNNIE